MALCPIAAAASRQICNFSSGFKSPQPRLSCVDQGPVLRYPATAFTGTPPIKPIGLVTLVASSGKLASLAGCKRLPLRRQTVLIAGLLFGVVVTLLLSVAGPEPGVGSIRTRAASRG